MKVAVFAAALLSAGMALGQGAMIPPLTPMRNSAGGTASGAKLCTFVAGTTTPQQTYSDKELTKPLPNPISLNSGGYPTSTGSAVTSVYLMDAAYKFIIYNSGTGNFCNGRPVGSAIWTRDNIFDYGQSLGEEWIDAIPSFAISAGTYIPTLTCDTNCTTVSSNILWLYVRVGDRVIVDGRLTMNPGTGGATALVTLPIESHCNALLSQSDLFGVAVVHLSAVPAEPGGHLSCDSGGVSGGPASALLHISSPAGTERTYSVSFQYEIK